VVVTVIHKFYCQTCISAVLTKFVVPVDNLIYLKNMGSYLYFYSAASDCPIQAPSCSVVDGHIHIGKHNASVWCMSVCLSSIPVMPRYSTDSPSYIHPESSTISIWAFRLVVCFKMHRCCCATS